MPNTRPSSGMANKPPPMPRTPPMKPIDAPDNRHPATTRVQSTYYSFVADEPAAPLSTQTLHSDLDAVHRNELQAFNGLPGRVGLAAECGADAQIGGFLEAFLTADRRPDLTHQPHPAQRHQPARQRAVSQ